MMPSAHDRFAAALLDPGLPCPVRSAATAADEAEARFAVYRNNVVGGLVNALAARYPVAARILGDRFFRAMACLYVRAFPPHTPMLFAYGADFPAFVDGFPPADPVPYLGDLMRLEWARGEAYHAADARPAGPEALAVPPDRLDAVRVRMHPAARLVRSRHPIVTIWSMQEGVGEPASLQDWMPEAALVTRPRLAVRVECLGTGEAVFLDLLQRGEPLARALEAGLAVDPRFDPPAAVATLIRAGAALSLDA
ncbi:DNA-binding domain-containing protein [Prosthecomicrobium sp. N25]|uniref:DNA-binding domain-containing protein n=1 Tax=Prosthecomicrobium sp. N25 TaxID=3129254 RepID=UPI0030783625